LCYKSYKSTKWLREVIRVFKTVKQDPSLGKNLAWPNPPKLLEEALGLLKEVHAVWRAHTIVGRLTKDEQQLVRQKIVAYDIFHGKKYWESSKKFEADYLQLDSNPGKDKYLAGMEALFSRFGDSQVLYADYVTKVNSKDKGQRRAIVVTDKFIHKQDPKNYKVKKFETPLTEITSIALSSKEDCFVIIHAREPYRDLVLDMGLASEERYSEFVSVICFFVKKTLGIDIKVEIMDNIPYNTARTPKNSKGNPSVLTFQKATDPKQVGSQFKGVKGGGVVLFVPFGK